MPEEESSYCEAGAVCVVSRPVDGTEVAHRDLMNRSAPDHASLTSTDWSGLSRRLACAGYLGTVALCSGLAFVAVCRGELGCLGVAAGAGVLALGLKTFLRSGSGLLDGEVSAKNDEGEFWAEPDGLTARAGELAGLLRTWSELERARGTRRFDAWAWQSLRTEIRERLREDPELRRLLGIGE